MKRILSKFIATSVVTLLLLPNVLAIVIEDFGRKKDYVVAQDELSLRRVGQKRIVHRLDVPAANQAEVIRLARQRTKDAAAYDLVLYPKGQEGVASARRILKPRMVVKLRPGANAGKLAERYGLAYKAVRGNTNLVILDFPDSAAALEMCEQIRNDKAVLSAQPILARMLSKRAVPTDPLFSYSQTNTNYQWHLWNTGQNGGVAGIDVNILNVWNDYNGNGVTIGIVDDGLEHSHEDLVSNADTTLDHNWNDGNPNDASPVSEFDSHGTSVAGVAAARWENNAGGTGAAPLAKLVGLRLIAGEVGDDEEAAALGWATDVIDVYNNSWGPPDQGRYEDAGELVKAAFQDGCTSGRDGLGVIYMWAGGNGREYDDNSNYDGYANSIYTIAVGAVNDQGKQSYYSESGANLVICAPSNGEDTQGITTTSINNDYTNEFGGTSSATPLASGVVALVLEANPNLGWRDVQEILIRSARKVDPGDAGWSDNGAEFHFNHKYGAGMIDAEAAVALAKAWQNLGPQTVLSIRQDDINLDIPEGRHNPLVRYFDFSSMPNKRVEHVQVRIDAKHFRVRDLECVLVSPSGTRSILSEISNMEAVGVDLPNWTFMTVHNWGENSKGVWTLEIRDLRTGVQGLLKDIEVIVRGVDDPDAEINFPPIISSPNHVAGRINEPMTYTLSTLGATSTVEFVGPLPAGMSYDAGTRTLSGVPTEEGIYKVKFNVTNNSNEIAFILNFVVGGEPQYDLAGAIELNGLNVSSDGDGVWHMQSTDTFDGSDAVSSPADLPNLGVSNLRHVHAGGGVVLFDWKVLSEEGKDRLWFFPSGSGYQDWAGFISGNVPWGRFATKLPEGETTMTWSYRKSEYIHVDQEGASVDRVEIIPVDEYSQKLTDFSGSNLVFETDSRALWIPVDWPESEDSKALRSSAVGNGQKSELRSYVQGPGLISFAWKVSSEQADKLDFIIDGAVVESISGEVAWQEKVFAVGEGRREIKWRYLKNAEQSSGNLDGGLVDSINFLPATNYTEWASGLFTPAQLVDGSVSGADADPNQNGFSNLIEYAFGGNPLLNNGSIDLPRMTMVNGNPTFTYKANGLKRDLNYILQVSADLESWTDVTGTVLSTVDGVSTISYVLNFEGGMSEGIPMEVPMRYARVKVVQTLP